MSNQRRFALIGRGFGSDSFNQAVVDYVGSILTDSSEINFTYTSATPSITAALIDGSVTFARLQNADAVSVLGRSANSSGVLDEIAASANDRLLRRTGDTLNFGQLTAGMFPNTVVPDAALSSNVPLLNATNTFSVDQTFSGDISLVGNLLNSANSTSLNVSGGTSAVTSAHLELFGSTHATLANRIYLAGDQIDVRTTDEATLIASFTTAEIEFNTTLVDLNANLDVSGTLLFADGAAATPALAFSADTDTGFYRIPDNVMALATAGAIRCSWSANTTQMLNNVWRNQDTNFSGVSINNISAPTFQMCNLTVPAATAMLFARLDNGVGGARFFFLKSRGATINNYAAVQSGDILGTIEWAADDGGDYTSSAALIRAVVNGTVGTNDTPGRIEFLTAAAGSNNPSTVQLMVSAAEIDLTATTLDFNGTLDVDGGNHDISTTGTLTISGTGETLATFVDDGAVTLYHNNVIALATTAAGVDIGVGATINLRTDADTTAGNTRLLIWDVDNGALERVSVGAADSGGAGFKVLRIPN